MVLQTYSNDSRFFWRCWGVNVAVAPVAASSLLWLHATDNGTRSQAESKTPPARRVDISLVRFMAPPSVIGSRVGLVMIHVPRPFIEESTQTSALRGFGAR